MDGSPEFKLVLRPEYDEWRLLEQHPELYEAVLVKEAYAAPYPEDHAHHARDADRLIKAIPADSELWRDPDTAGLVSQSTARLKRTSRVRMTPLAREFEMPLDLTRLLGNPALRDLALDRVLESQPGSATLIPPYFDVDRRDGVAQQLNLQMLRRAIAAAGDEVPTAMTR